ncbi:MAG: DUF6145 family protein [Lachnospiraceae bacterium]|jgi:hypothetical protein|nr:DUF6145 family protein [Lachnospiraceae bacterium]
MLPQNRIVICGANAYTQKYYLNPSLDILPNTVKEELQIMSVLFTQEAGGLFLLFYQNDGTVTIETRADDTDYSYDEITAGLLVGKIQRQKQELFQSLEQYYQATQFTNLE